MKCIQRVLLSSVLVLLVVLVASVSAQDMKIAVPAVDSEPNASISKETGRAPFFLFFDDKGHFLEAIQNPAKDQFGGVSRTVVALLIAHDINLIIVESIGDKMKLVLIDHHIKIVNKTGTALDAVEAIIQY